MKSRLFFTVLLLIWVFFAFVTQNFAQDKMKLIRLVQSYNRGEKLSKEEFELIENVLPPSVPRYRRNPFLHKGSLGEGFENETFPPQGWTVINNDGGGNEWRRYTSDAHSGNACAAVYYEKPNDDWLVTPRIEVKSGDFLTFWAKSYSSSYPEDFNVKVSKSGNSVNDFTITLEEIRSAPNSWQEHTYDLVNGGYGINDGDSIYIAIQCVSYDKWRLLIDDVSVYSRLNVPGSPQNPDPANNARNVAYSSGTLTWDFGNNTDKYDLWFGPSGNMSKVVSDSAAGASGSYSYSDLNSGTKYQWQVIAKNSTSGETTNGPVWDFTTALPQNLYQIGYGTNTGKHMPIEPYFGYTYSQTIYPASELSSVGSNKRIKKIYYNYHKSSSGDDDSNDWVIYFGTTRDSVIADWIPVDSLTKVYDGNTGYGDIAPGDGWMEITLDSPFNYDPAADGNLIVAVDENTPGYTSSADEFYCDVNSAKANVSIYYYSDDTNPDPASPPSGTKSAYYPNIRFEFEDIPTSPVFSVTPESHDFGTVTLGDSSAAQTFTVTNAGIGTLQISTVTIVGADSNDFVLNDGNTYPVNLAENESVTVSVEFAPEKSGSRSATLRFTANVKTDHDVTLTGTGYDPVVRSYPYDEPFTNFTVSSNATGYADDWSTSPSNTASEFRWNPNSGGTLSSNTGPDADHTSGNSSGKYLYSEASNGAEGDSAFVYTPQFDLSSLSNPGVKFYYHMYGSAMGRLDFDISTDNGSTWKNLFSVSGEQQSSGSEPWISYYKNISPYAGKTVKFRFKAVKGANFRSDMAIDDFRIAESDDFTNKKIDSVTVKQASEQPALVGSSDVEILELDFYVDDGPGTLPLNSVTVTSKNDDDNDISSVKFYRSDTTVFNTDTLLGKTVFMNGAANFTNINYNLPSGISRLFVAYDIDSLARVGNNMDAKIAANDINVNGNSYNSGDEDPSGSRTISGLVVDSIIVSQASTKNVNVGSRNNKILKIEIKTKESTQKGGRFVRLKELSVKSKNTDDTYITDVKIYRTNSDCYNTDSLLANGQFENGTATMNIGDARTSDTYYWVSYDIAPNAPDSSHVDAEIPPNGIVINDSTYGANGYDPAGSRMIINYNRGGGKPENGGYYFANSTEGAGAQRPTYEWVEISSTGTDVYDSLSGPDGYAGGAEGYAFGFPFPFFNSTYERFWIAADGFVSLGNVHASPTNQNVPDSTLPNAVIAPFWDNLIPPEIPQGGEPSHIYYQVFPDKVVVTYEHIYSYYASYNTQWITLQVIMYKNGNIKFQYKGYGNDMYLDDCTVGLEDSLGTHAVNYLYNGEGGPIFDYNAQKADNGLAIVFSKDESATPVELESFTATANKEGFVELEWTTATEVNTAVFEIERAEHLENENTAWQVIAKIEAAGNSNAPRKYKYKDNLSHSGKYKYRLKIIDLDGSYKYGEIVEVTAEIPLEYELSQNYPNPFNPTTTINFSIKTEDNVKLTVYNVLGEKITDLVNKKMKAGRYKIEFNASNLASGVYFYRLRSGKFVSVKKMLLLK